MKSFKSFKSLNAICQNPIAASHQILNRAAAMNMSTKFVLGTGLVGTSYGLYSTFPLSKTFTNGWIYADSQAAGKDDRQTSGQNQDAIRSSGNTPTPADPSNYKPTHPQVEKLNEILKDAKSVKDLDITLFQYQVCPFCCKVRAFLDKNKIPYKVIEVHPISKSEIKWSKQYKKVPIIIVNGMQINDSSVIISSLNRFMRKINGLDPMQVDENELKWRKWVDDRFVRVLPPNIYRTYEEARSSFDYITQRGEFSYWQQKIALYGGALAMWGVSKKLSKKYNIVDERATLYDCANEWCQSIPKGQPFQGGLEPNLADLAVYGILSSIEGLQAFNDMCENTEISTFYYRMKDNIGASSFKKIDLKEAQPVIDSVTNSQSESQFSQI